jgi:hypothetical protein
MKLFIIVIIILSISSCINFAENDIIKSIVSPDEKYVAVSFIRSAGATTSFSPQVSILSKSKKLQNKSGNIFIGDNSKYIDILWEDNKTLIIYHNCKADKIFKQYIVYKDIKIKYIKILDDMEIIDKVQVR